MDSQHLNLNMEATERKDDEVVPPLMIIDAQHLNLNMETTERKDDEVVTPLMVNNSALTNEWIRFPLFRSVPALNSCLAKTISCMTCCCSESSEPAVREFPSLEMATFPPEGIIRPPGSRFSVNTDSGNAASNDTHIHDRTSRRSDGNSTENANGAVESTQNSQTGVSALQRLIEKARRSVRGSADDIGWLQRDPQMPPVEDGTERFMEIISDIRRGVHKLTYSMVYLLVPEVILGQKWSIIDAEHQKPQVILVGLFSNHGPLYFVNAKKYLSQLGLTCLIAKIHSEASVEKNAREIKEYIDELYWGSRKQVLLLGHSKGGVDAAAALSIYWPDLKDKVAGLALAQSPYGGSPIASDLLRKGKLGDYVHVRKLMEILMCKVIKGDMEALEDLTYEKRKEFLKKNHLPREVPIVSLHTQASISPSVLATLSRVAHAELPIISPLSCVAQSTSLPVVIPASAAMAASAQLLQSRYGVKSDGLVTCSDAEVPGSVVVRPKRKLDHAWIVYSALNDDPSEPDASQVCEALLTLLVEVGEKKKHEHAVEDL